MLTPHTNAEIIHETRANIVLYTLPRYIIILSQPSPYQRRAGASPLLYVRASLTNSGGFVPRLFCALLDVFHSERRQQITRPASCLLSLLSLANLGRVKVKVSQLCPTLRPHGLYSPWNSLGQNTGVSSLSLLLGIFPTQGSNPGLLHYRWDP